MFNSKLFKRCFRPVHLAQFALLFLAAHALAGNPSGSSIISPDPAAISYIGPGNAAEVAKLVPVVGQEFPQALQVSTYGLVKPNKADYGLYARLVAPVKKGDVLWLSFKARSLESKRESGEAYLQLRLDQLVNGKFKWPPYLETTVSVGADWTQISVPYEMEQDIAAQDMRLAMSFDQYPQRFEISPITFINCGAIVKVKDLPRTAVRYEGSAPDAPWRKAAADRIEKHRKGDLTIKAVDTSGAPVVGADVAVRMKRLDYLIGTAITSERIVDAPDVDSQKYREILTKYFNHIVFENEMKWPHWASKGHNPERTLRAVDELRKLGMTARGHTMVWPSWSHLPPQLKKLKDDKPALRRAVLENIQRQTSVMKGKFIQWDVTNELFSNHDLIDILGRDVIAEWFQAAHEAAPDVKLFYNEYTMLHPDGPSVEHFYETVKFLQAQRAPVQGLGEQAHVGGSPPGIPHVLARLDRFGALGLPIIITEFDMGSTRDEDFQAAYMRDFMTAVFSDPNTLGIVQWGFWAGQHWMPNAALWNKDWTIRKHGQAFVDLVTKRWWTNADGSTASDGTFATRGFYGDYDISVTHGGQTTTVQHKFNSGTEHAVIQLP